MGNTSSTTIESISKDAAQCWGAEAADKIVAVQNRQTTWQEILAGIVGVYGYIKQAELLERQVDLQERTVEHSERYLQLAERTFNEVTLDAYQCQKSLFRRYTSDLDACVDEFLGESKRLTEYTPEYIAKEGRAVSSVTRNIGRARRNRARSRSKYATGTCCHEDIWFDLETSRLQTEAANAAYRQEEERKDALDQWYWQRQTVGAQLVENYRAQVINGTNSGVTNVANGLNAIGNAVTSVRASSNQLAGAIRDQASFFGTLSNGAFRFAGFGDGYRQATNAPQSSYYGTGVGQSLFNAVAGPGGFGPSGGSGLLGTASSPGTAFGSSFGFGVGGITNGGFGAGGISGRGIM